MVGKFHTLHPGPDALAYSASSWRLNSANRYSRFEVADHTTIENY